MCLLRSAVVVAHLSAVRKFCSRPLGDSKSAGGGLLPAAGQLKNKGVVSNSVYHLVVLYRGLISSCTEDISYVCVGRE